MKLSTVSLDCHGTGEGRTLLGWIGYAEGAEDALQPFGQTFGDYFAVGADPKEGIVEDKVIRHLFAASALADAHRFGGRANVQLTGRLHFNLAWASLGGRPFQYQSRITRVLVR